ncbi:MAG: hypothetical protein Q7K48_08680 [Fusobacterium sp. JB021]|nr:hypothetical protein [Fusobacterium sp. JB020]MDP0494359.1 hypothetical protein [Fusobacterium sp. JB021]MDP0506711.1 hypothetical protein [Fusobacterium sp. JB019]
MKKKNILIGLTLISALSFAQGGNNDQKETMKKEYCNTQTKNVNLKHSNEQHHEKMMGSQKRKKSNLPKELKLELDKKRIHVQELNLSVKKMLLEEKVDWNKVEETNKNIGLTKAEIKTSIQKFRHTHKNK